MIGARPEVEVWAASPDSLVCLNNRLGQALMLCYLRYPGRQLKTGERPPGALLSFVAEQIDASLTIISPLNVPDSVMPPNCRIG